MLQDRKFALFVVVVVSHYWWTHPTCQGTEPAYPLPCQQPSHVQVQCLQPCQHRELDMAEWLHTVAEMCHWNVHGVDKNGSGALACGCHWTCTSHTVHTWTSLTHLTALPSADFTDIDRAPLLFLLILIWTCTWALHKLFFISFYELDLNSDIMDIFVFHRQISFCIFHSSYHHLILPPQTSQHTTYIGL